MKLLPNFFVSIFATTIHNSPNNKSNKNTIADDANPSATKTQLKLIEPE